MEKHAVESDGLTIPLVDFSHFLHGTPSSRQETAGQILHAFQTAGFVYLKGLPISAETRRAVFASSAAFFGLPTETKESLGWTTPQANRGYMSLGREKVTLVHETDQTDRKRAEVPDIKESFEVGRPDDASHPNRWPDDAVVPDFRSTMLDFFATCQQMHVQIMRAIAVAMGLHDERYFDAFVDVADNNLRLLHYPAVRKEVFRVNPGQVRAGEHSDYGSITLLFQDARGGLQVQSPHGTFVDATPIEDTVVVNAGDLLARWSNDTIRSTVHRVVEPPAGVGEPGRAEVECHPARYSIAYFCNPNYKDKIDAIPGTYATEADKKYESITSGDYMISRLSVSY